MIFAARGSEEECGGREGRDKARKVEVNWETDQEI